MNAFNLDSRYDEIDFLEVSVEDLTIVSGGSGGARTGHPDNAWNSNDSLSATVVRHAGFGALGGAIGGPKGAIAGAVVGALHGFNQYYS